MFLSRGIYCSLLKKKNYCFAPAWKPSREPLWFAVRVPLQKKRRPLGRRSSTTSNGRKATSSAVNGNPWVAVPAPKGPLLLQLTATQGSPFLLSQSATAFWPLLLQYTAAHKGRRGRQSGGLSWPPHKRRQKGVAVGHE